MINRILDVFCASQKRTSAIARYQFPNKALFSSRTRSPRQWRGLSVLRIVAVVLLLGIMDIAAALDINVADAKQIAQGLKGVGLKKAQAIVDYRAANGRFSSLDDLLKVKGVGKKLLQLNAGNISFKADVSGSAKPANNAASKSASRQ